MASDSDNAISGGLLVVLGIIIALIAVYAFVQYSDGFGNKADITIQTDSPNTDSPNAPNPAQPNP